MSTIGETAAPGQAAAKRQLYCGPLDQYWDALRAWWKRERLRQQLCRLSEHELADIGLTPGEIDHAVLHRSIGRDGDGLC
jgi:uncharacterized protein YjiS (DUF1127 family)